MICLCFGWQKEALDGCKRCKQEQYFKYKCSKKDSFKQLGLKKNVCPVLYLQQIREETGRERRREGMQQRSIQVLFNQINYLKITQWEIPGFVFNILSFTVEVYIQ